MTRMTEMTRPIKAKMFLKIFRVYRKPVIVVILVIELLIFQGWDINNDSEYFFNHNHFIIHNIILTGVMR
jgi:hypothetical protein